MSDIASGLVYYVVFLFSTTLHEAAHAWAAKLGGDLTAYHGGQVTLDPRPHIRREPFGMVILPLLSALTTHWPIGFASAPYDPQWALRHPKRAGWMAAAGPGANLSLVIVSAIAMRVGIMTGAFASPSSVGFDHLVAASQGGGWQTLAFVLSVFFSLNLVLACLNIIPLPPLDGSSAIAVLLPDASAARYQEFMIGRGRGLAMVGMLAAWWVFPDVFRPVFLFAVNLLHPGAHYG